MNSLPVETNSSAHPNRRKCRPGIVAFEIGTDPVAFGLSRKCCSMGEKARMALAVRATAFRSPMRREGMLAFERKRPPETIVLNVNDTVKLKAVMLERILGEDMALETVLADSLCLALADPCRWRVRSSISLSTRATPCPKVVA
jgi:hypothetical protein